MATNLVPVPTSNCHRTLLSHRYFYNVRFHASSNCLLPPYPSAAVAASRSVTHITPCSSTSSVVVEQEGQDEDEEEVTSASPQPSYDDLPPGACKACGKTEIERGCNGEGRIQGGIATVPGFGWWPIKAYRPCPAFVASGGRYTRQGQSMDEVAFGRGERGSPVTMVTEDVQSRKKKKDPRKFKR